jgi:hypothetical protein
MSPKAGTPTIQTGFPASLKHADGFKNPAGGSFNRARLPWKQVVLAAAFGEISASFLNPQLQEIKAHVSGL